MYIYVNQYVQHVQCIFRISCSLQPDANLMGSQRAFERLSLVLPLDVYYADDHM